MPDILEVAGAINPSGLHCNCQIFSPVWYYEGGQWIIFTPIYLTFWDFVFRCTVIQHLLYVWLALWTVTCANTSCLNFCMLKNIYLFNLFKWYLKCHPQSQKAILRGNTGKKMAQKFKMKSVLTIIVMLKTITKRHDTM